MDGDLQRLPSVYAEYLSLHRLGIAHEDIARRLGVDVQVVPLMHRLALAKLQALSIADPETSSEGQGEPSPDGHDLGTPDPHDG